MTMSQHTRSVLNVGGFIAFVMFSCAASFGLLILTPIVISWFLGVRLIWAVPIGLVIILVFSLLSALGTEDSKFRSLLPNSLKRIRPEHTRDVHIVVFGTAVLPVLLYAFTRSTVIALIAGVISFVYFFFIQSAIRASRGGLKFIPNWHAEQQKVARNVIEQLRSGDDSVDKTYCLFLRPFDSVPHEYNLYRDEYIPLEERIAETIQHECPVIAVGRKLPVGPGYVTSEDWQTDVGLLMKHAAAILLLPDNTPGMVYEVNHIIQNSYLLKTLFIGPPSERNTKHWETHWQEITSLLESAGLQVPQYRGSGLVFH
jgi:hypothetical protein